MENGINYEAMTDAELRYAFEFAHSESHLARGSGDYELAARYSTEAVAAYKTIAKRAGAYC